jgi:hypothetical protein
MIPTDLRIVAVLQLLGGFSALLHMVVALPDGRLTLDFGVFGIGAYLGLLRLDPKWRTWTVVVTGLGCVAAVLIPIVGMATGMPAHWSLFGIPVGDVSWTWIGVAATPLFFLCLWQYRVVTRPEIRALFTPEASAPA